MLFVTPGICCYYERCSLASSILLSPPAAVVGRHRGGMRLPSTKMTRNAATCSLVALLSCCRGGDAFALPDMANKAASTHAVIGCVERIGIKNIYLHCNMKGDFPYIHYSSIRSLTFTRRPDGIAFRLRPHSPPPLSPPFSPFPSPYRATQLNPEPRKLDDFPALADAYQSGSHPRLSRDELGTGAFIMDDWRKAWYTYGRCDKTMTTSSGGEDPSGGSVVDQSTGMAEYEIDDVDGTIPDDLVGVLYRIGESLEIHFIRHRFFHFAFALPPRRRASLGSDSLVVFAPNIYYRPRRAR